MFKYFTILSLIIITILGIIVGAESIYIARMYDAAVKSSVSDRIGSIKRILKIETIDLERKLIGAVVVDRELFNSRNVLLSIDSATAIQRQDPIFENGIVTSFSPIKTISLNDLSIDSEVFAWITILDDGRLYARTLIVGSPFARP